MNHPRALMDVRPTADAGTFTDRTTTVPWWVAAALLQMGTVLCPRPSRDRE